MPDCSDLDPQVHDLLKLIERLGVKRKTGVARTTVTTLADVLKVPRTEVRHLLEGLEQTRFSRFEEDSGRIVMLESCSCQLSIFEPLGSGTERPRTDQGRRHWEGSGSEGSEVQRTKSSKERARSRPRPARAAKPIEKFSHVDLAMLFSTRMQDANRGRGAERSHWVAVGAANHGALAKQFKTWMKDDGVTATQIAAMIDAFVADPRNYADSPAPAWKTFLADRQRLLKRASTRAAEDAPDLGWDAPLAEDDEDEGLGWENFGKPLDIPTDPAG